MLRRICDSKSTQFLKNHDIPSGVTLVVTCDLGGKISLEVKHLNCKVCPDKITVIESQFGENFRIDATMPLAHESYARDKHFFDFVNSTSVQIFPSPHYQDKKKLNR